jgi:glycosyltransferase involved in cell wall biosynthesis
MKDLVSVIIPCYNQGSYLSEAVDSVINQTYPNIEIIIINDGSADNTDAIAKEWCTRDKRITYLDQDNQGLSMARNNGIKKSKGLYILPLDGDDKIAPDYLEKAINILSNNAKIGIVYGRSMFFGAQSGEWDLPDFSIEAMLKRNLIFCSAVFRRSDFDRTTGYNKNMKYGWEDWDLWLSFLERELAVFKLDQVVFHYRIKDSSMVTGISTDPLKRQYLESQLIANHLELYQKYFPEPLTLLRELDALQEEKESFERYKKEILGSMSYRIGDFILKPFKWLKKINGQ